MAVLLLTTYIERVESHSVFSLIDKGLEYADTILHFDNLDESSKEHVERLRYVYEQIRNSLRNFDQALISINILNNGNNHLTNSNNCLNNYIGNRQVSYLVDANSHLDNFLLQAPGLFNPRTVEEIDNFRESISSFRRSVAQHNRNSDEDVRKITEENNKLRVTITELSSQINAEKQRIDNIISQFQQQINTFQQQFSQAEDKRRETFTEDLEEWNNEVEKEKTSRTTAYTGIISTLESQNESHKLSLELYNSSLQKKFEEAANETLGTIYDYKKQVEKLLGAISETGQAIGYKNVANEERKAKRFWRGVTVSSMLLLITFAAVIAYESYSKEFNIATFGVKVFGALSVGTLVAYAARQASLHGQSENANRKMELELAAIGPFLAGFPDKEIQEIKRELVKSFFGKEDLSSKNNEEVPKGSLDAVKIALETVQQLIKGKG
ncbi:hypothetical protein LJR153_000600 [Paenibacillus sp. LjRoot153]|uniref:hypothetical protein n=1 Tax=Paenibacillus sp. LjRoot153 TaxID=3342270 RepID=UPI003ECFFB9E